MGDLSTPRVAFDAAGNGVLVWQRAEPAGNPRHLWLSRHGTVGSWGVPHAIPLSGADCAENWQTAFDAEGNLFLAWQQRTGTGRSIWAIRVNAAGIWGEAQLLEHLDGDASELVLNADNAGNVFAVWRQDSGAGSGIFANRDVAGAGWGAAQRLDGEFPGSAEQPRLAVNAAGDALVVWQSQGSRGGDVWATRFRASRGWERPERLNADAAGANAPDVSLNRDADAVAVWEQRSGARTVIAARHYRHDAGWAEARLISGLHVNARLPRVALDAEGNGVVVWEQQEATRWGVWSNRFVAGTGWMQAALIDGNRSSHARRPRVSLTAGGNAVAAWRQVDGAHANVVIARLSDSHWSSPAVLDADNVGMLSTADSDQLQLAPLPTGNVVAVWRQRDGTASTVRLGHLR